MHAQTGILAVVGSVCMTLALVLAWCLAGVRSSRFVKPATPFGTLMVLSFTATTVGYGRAAWSVAQAIIHSRYLLRADANAVGVTA